MGLSIVAVTINCRDPRSLAEWWTETPDEGEITHDLGEYVFVHAGLVELGFQGVAAAARERIRLHLDLEADDPEAEVRRLVDRGAVVSSSSTSWRRWAWRGRCCAIRRATTYSMDNSDYPPFHAKHAGGQGIT